MRFKFAIGAVVLAIAAATAGFALEQRLTDQVVVDGYVIGPDRTCADLGLPEARCQGLIARAINLAPARPASITGHTLHDVGQMVVDGQPQLAAFGAGPVYGLVLIDYADGTRQTELLGCIGIRSPEGPPDPLCPTSDASPAP